MNVLQESARLNKLLLELLERKELGSELSPVRVSNATTFEIECLLDVLYARYVDNTPSGLGRGSEVDFPTIVIQAVRELPHALRRTMGCRATPRHPPRLQHHPYICYPTDRVTAQRSIRARSYRAGYQMRRRPMDAPCLQHALYEGRTHHGGRNPKARSRTNGSDLPDPRALPQVLPSHHAL